MVKDAFDPGEDGSYPWFPRLADGNPAWSDSAATDGIPVAGLDGLTTTPMPRGLRSQAGKLVDLTPRSPDGTPLNPPTRPHGLAP